MALAMLRVVPLAVVVGLAASCAAPAFAWTAPLQEPVAPQAGSAPDADRPLQAGTEVPAPRRKHLVLPEYPEAAKALGVRGIVLIELIIERDGSVGEAHVVRSIPGLDEAALSAVRQWEYELTQVDGKPVRVRLAVPITFSMKLPELEREDGVPELRQGVNPAFPGGGGGGTTVEAEVTLDANGHVAEALITKGESPWAESLLRALRTWIFAWDDPTALVAFRVQAEFVRGRKDDDSQIKLRAVGARRLEAINLAPPAAQPSPVAARAPETHPAPPAAVPAPAAAPPAAPGPAAPVPPSAPAPAAAPASPAPVQPVEASAPARPATPAPRAADVPAPPAAAPPADAKPRPANPPVEVIRVPPPPAPPAAGTPGAAPGAAPQPAQPGYSSVRDVALGIGVPDLAQGRRPTVPPFARMAGVTGTVEVAFSVGASGLTAIQTTTGPDPLQLTAKEMVQSWSFRRTSTERLYLLAVVEYGADTAKAKVSLVP